jgi:hypothetical protein
MSSPESTLRSTLPLTIPTLRRQNAYVATHDDSQPDTPPQSAEAIDACLLKAEDDDLSIVTFNFDASLPPITLDTSKDTLFAYTNLSMQPIDLVEFRFPCRQLFSIDLPTDTFVLVVPGLYEWCAHVALLRAFLLEPIIRDYMKECTMHLYCGPEAYLHINDQRVELKHGDVFMLTGPKNGTIKRRCATISH